jgi:hypothetical protein
VHRCPASTEIIKEQRGWHMEKDHLEILLEDMNKKFDLVLEGHAVLGKKIDDNAKEVEEKFELTNLQIKAVSQKIDNVEAKLSQKIDAVASDLAEHRADTEKHRIEYKVSE